MGAWIQAVIFILTLIWGAATIKAGLRGLTERLERFERTVEKASELVAATLTNHAERISRIEGKLLGD